VKQKLKIHFSRNYDFLHTNLSKMRQIVFIKSLNFGEFNGGQHMYKTKEISEGNRGPEFSSSITMKSKQTQAFEISL